MRKDLDKAADQLEETEQYIKPKGHILVGMRTLLRQEALAKNNQKKLMGLKKDVEDWEKKMKKGSYCRTA